MPLKNWTFEQRRQFLARMGIGAGVAGAFKLFEPGVFAEELQKLVMTPQTTEGPFYPDHLPLDTDNDLLIVNDGITPAVGEVTHLSGRITDAGGQPVRNAVVEIWQVDNFGSYIHSRGTNRQTNKHDGNFQGYGRFMTRSSGEYYFRTIKPVPYPGRTPHIHVKVKAKGQESLTTQIFVAGEARNRSDMVLHGILDPKQRQAVLTDFSPIQSSTAGELAAKFDIVLGETPDA